MEIINVEQVRGNFYGGFPYRVSWSFNGESQPSTLSVEVVNEAGDYGKPEIGINNSQSISIGSFTFNGFLVGYSLNSNPDQKTLTLEYVDKSILLDKYWVGLKKVHADGMPNVILVGKQYHPCDINMDSTISFDESSSRQIDMCDPCPFSPPDKYKEVCDPRTLEIESLETYYTFSELVKEVQSNISELNIDFDAGNLYMYKAQHIGNLRSVLSSWASDLGLSFFWDPIQDKLIFKSRYSFGDESPVSYEDIVNYPKATEVSYKENILETFSQGFLGRYERPAEFNVYPCRKDTWKLLSPITLDDLFLREPTPVQSKYDGEISANSVAVALSYYSSSLRDAFLWFIHYGIMTAIDAEAYAEGDSGSGDDDNDNNNDDDNEGGDKEKEPSKTSEKVSGKGGGSGGSGSVRGNSFVPSATTVDESNFSYSTDDDCRSISDVKGSKSKQGDKALLSKYGNMKIREVYHINASEGRRKTNFIKLRSLMPPELVEIYKGKEGTTTDPRFYFFVAECSEEAYDEAVNADRNLANGFLGKFYFNKFRSIVTGGSSDKNECSVEGPAEDGSGNWIKAKGSAENIPIFAFGHDPESKVGRLKVSAIKDSEENERIESKRVSNFGINRKAEDYVANSFILFSRNNPKWSPEREFADKWYGSLYAWCNQQIPHKYANGDGRPDELYILFPEAKWNENIKLFMVKELDSLKVDIEKGPHKHEIKGGSKTRVEEDSVGNQFVLNEGPWGLRSTSCYIVNFNGVMPIYTPPGSFVEELSDYEDECTTAPSYSALEESFYTPATSSYSGPGYRVFVSCSSEFPKLIKKYQYSMGIPAENAGTVTKINYVDYELAEQNIAIFGDSCVPDSSIVDSYLRDLGSTSQYSYSNPLYSIDFKLAGAIPEIWNVQQGLSSIQVEITENGVYTSYNLSTKIIQPPSLAYTEQNLRFQKRPAFGNRLSNLVTARAKTIRR
jgi:hypothetical protein